VRTTVVGLILFGGLSISAEASAQSAEASAHSYTATTWSPQDVSANGVTAAGYGSLASDRTRPHTFVQTYGVDTLFPGISSGVASWNRWTLLSSIARNFPSYGRPRERRCPTTA
jgi:hypothetical protein